MSKSQSSLSSKSSSSPQPVSTDLHKLLTLIDTDLPSFPDESADLLALKHKISGLKSEIAAVKAKLHDNQYLIQAKDNENKELSEKLESLELTVQHLTGVFPTEPSPCCASPCFLF